MEQMKPRFMLFDTPQSQVETDIADFNPEYEYAVVDIPETDGVLVRFIEFVPKEDALAIEREMLEFYGGYEPSVEESLDDD